MGIYAFFVTSHVRNHRGMSLTEIMVALGVASIASLGAAVITQSLMKVKIEATSRNEVLQTAKAFQIAASHSNDGKTVMGINCSTVISFDATTFNPTRKFLSWRRLA